MILELQHKRPDGDADTYFLKPGRRYHLGRGSACEVRILDLKLSRKHAAIEFQDGAWTLIDLCSTNGCQLDGKQMVGTSPLISGSQVLIGSTTLVVARLITPSESGRAIAAQAASSSAAAPVSAPVVEELELSPPGGSAVEDRPDEETSDGLRPATAPVFASTEAALPVVRTPLPAIEAAVQALPPTGSTERPKSAPVSAPAATPERRSPSRPRETAIKPVTLTPERLDLEATVPTMMALPDPDAAPRADAKPAPRQPPPFVMPVAPTPLPSAPSVAPVNTAPAGSVSTSPAPVGNEDRTYFITVLGQRLGPLSRAVARDLKARELRGTLKASDLDAYPKA